MGGVAISPSAEVLDVNGYPILGLFGAGEVTGVSSCFFFVFFFEFFYDFKMKVFFFHILIRIFIKYAFIQYNREFMEITDSLETLYSSVSYLEELLESELLKFV